MLRYGMITCERCGVSWYGPKCGKRYCDDCRKKVNYEKMYACVKRKRESEELKKEEKQELSLTEVVRLADAAGMSYAKYCLKYGI